LALLKQIEQNYYEKSKNQSKTKWFILKLANIKAKGTNLLQKSETKLTI